MSTRQLWLVRGALVALLGLVGVYKLGPKLYNRHKLGQVQGRPVYDERINAQDALRLGIVNRVVPAEELEAATHELALKLAKGPTKAIGLMKRAINRSLTMDLEQLLEYEVHMQETAGKTEDHKEGLAAFMEKRAPEYKGR